MSNYKEYAEPLVRAAGKKAKNMIDHLYVRDTKEQGDLVTSADLEVEADILFDLEKQYPTHGFYSEERGKQHADAEYVWILDPIDGTKHYVKGNPFYAVSLALQHKGELVLGLVYLPELDQMFCAEKGSGATLNNRSIHCSVEERLEEIILCLEIPSRHAPSDERQWALEKMARLVDHVQRVRILGVGSIGLCLTALGGYDAYVNLSLAWEIYDLAAGQVVLQEAGGQFRTFGRWVVAGPATLCKKIETVLDLQEEIDKKGRR